MLRAPPCPRRRALRSFVMWCCRPRHPRLFPPPAPSPPAFQVLPQVLTPGLLVVVVEALLVVVLLVLLPAWPLTVVVLELALTQSLPLMQTAKAPKWARVRVRMSVRVSVEAGVVSLGAPI